MAWLSKHNANAFRQLKNLSYILQSVKFSRMIISFGINPGDCNWQVAVLRGFGYGLLGVAELWLCI
jgi:hypothetical protein